MIAGAGSIKRALFIEATIFQTKHRFSEAQNKMFCSFMDYHGIALHMAVKQHFCTVSHNFVNQWQFSTVIKAEISKAAIIVGRCRC